MHTFLKYKITSKFNHIKIVNVEKEKCLCTFGQNILVLLSNFRNIISVDFSSPCCFHLPGTPTEGN